MTEAVLLLPGPGSSPKKEAGMGTKLGDDRLYETPIESAIIIMDHFVQKSKGTPFPHYNQHLC